MSRKKLSENRVGKGLIGDAYEKMSLTNLSGTQAAFAVLLGAKRPLSIEEIASRFARSKVGIEAFENYKGSRFYKESDTVELYSLRRVRKLIPYGLNPHDVTYPLIAGDKNSGFRLTSLFDIALRNAIG